MNKSTKYVKNIYPKYFGVDLFGLLLSVNFGYQMNLFPEGNFNVTDFFCLSLFELKHLREV